VTAAADVLADVARELASISGRSQAAYEAYRLDGATRAIVALGSSAGTVKDVVDELRDQGQPVGLLKIRSFRPFPAEVPPLLAALDEVIVLDRADSPGGAPPLAAELAFSLRRVRPALRSHVYGLGGRDLHPADVRDVFAGVAPRYVGLREAQCPV
jgi:pyruvate ferredoxin oxidoreductase alpha subunit